ncbi:hypothetical protein V6Z12_D08G008300 [Gossypium hirsutum]
MEINNQIAYFSNRNQIKLSAFLHSRSYFLWFTSQDCAVVHAGIFNLPLVNIAEATIDTYYGAFLRTSNSSSVGKERPKTSLGLDFRFSLVVAPPPGKDSCCLQDEANKLRKPFHKYENKLKIKQGKHMKSFIFKSKLHFCRRHIGRMIIGYVVMISFFPLISNLGRFGTFSIITRRTNIHKANSFHHLHLGIQ